jgi:predicted Zn-dependent peptidase
MKNYKENALIRVTALSNGIRVVSDSIDHVDTTAIGIWIQVGSRYEPLKLNGISHMLEHMAFKGTKTLSAQGIAEKIESVGGRLNAYTAREITAYYARVLADDLPLAVELLADILQNSLFAEEELEREKQVILQEIALVQDTPDDLIFDDFQATAFQNQALGRSILGSTENVSDFERNHLLQFMQQYYTPKRMVLVASGKVNHDHLLQLADKHLNQFSHKEADQHEQAVYTGGINLNGRDLEQVHAILGFKGCSLGSDLLFPYSILGTVLGGGMSSRLFQEVREKRGLVYSINSFTSSFNEVGVLGIYAGMAPSHVQEVIPLIFEELQKVAKTIHEVELNRAKQQLKASQLMMLENVANRCEQLAHHMVIYGRPLSKEEILKKIDAVGLEDIKALVDTVVQSQYTLSSVGTTKSLNQLEQIMNSWHAHK